MKISMRGARAFEIVALTAAVLSLPGWGSRGASEMTSYSANATNSETCV
jgi:hypothetical protein